MPATRARSTCSWGSTRHRTAPSPSPPTPRACSRSCARCSDRFRPMADDTPAAAIEEMRIRAPAQRNRKLEALLDAVNADTQLKAWWYMQQTNATRLGMSDHGWVHVQK